MSKLPSVLGACALFFLAASARAQSDDDLERYLLPPEPSARRQIDLDGSMYRAALARGRRLSRAGDHEGARPLLEAASRSRYDRGWALAELLRDTRVNGERDAELEEHAANELSGWRADRAPRAAIAYELGRRAEERGEISRAASFYLRALDRRRSAETVARLQRLGRERPVDVSRAFASARVLEQANDWEARCAHDCRIIRRLESNGVVYVVVAAREISPGEVEVDGQSFYIDSLVESVFLYIGRAGRWWSMYLATVQRDSFAGIDTTFRLARFELAHGMLRIDVRSRMVDYDACESGWDAEDIARVCGMDGDRAVCWAEIATLRDHGWAGGRVVFHGTSEEIAECGMPVGLLTASDRARLQRPRPPVHPRFQVTLDARGRLRVRGPVPEAFTGPIEVRDVPALVGGFE